MSALRKNVSGVRTYNNAIAPSRSDNQTTSSRLAINNYDSSECTVHEQTYITELEENLNKLNKVACKNKELQIQFMENSNSTLIKTKNKNKELSDYKDLKEDLHRRISVLNEKNHTLVCQLNKQNEKHQRLENNYKLLNDDLVKERNHITYYKNQNHNQKKRLSEDLHNATQMLDKANNELERKTEEHCKLILTLEILNEKISRVAEKHDIEKLKLIKTNSIMNTELEIVKFRNAELNATVCEQNRQLQNQTELLGKCDEKNEKLMQTIANDKRKSNDSLNALKKDKLNVESERKGLKQKLEEHLGRLKSLGLENERLKARNNEIQCELDQAIKFGDEKLKLSTEKMKNMDEERNRLCIKLTSRNQTITELAEQLSLSKRTYKAETENVYDLDRKFKNVCQRPNTYGQSSNVSTSSFFQSYTKILDEMKSTGEYPHFSNSENNSTECLEKNQHSEQFISRCEYGY